MRIGDIMSTAVETAGQDVGAGEALERMKRKGCHHLVVTDGGRVVGVISERDLGGRSGAAARRNRTVAELMTDKPATVSPHDTVREAANKMRGRSIGCLPVLDEGRLVGIITVTDLLDLIGRGVERPIVATHRWTLKHRGPRRQKMGPTPRA